jgi:hypothetical protein
MKSDLSCLLKNISEILFLLINFVKRKDLKQSFRFSHINVAMNNLVITRNTVTDTNTSTFMRFIFRTPDDGEGGGCPLAHTPRLFLPQGVAFLGPSTAVLASIDPGSMCLTIPY